MNWSKATNWSIARAGSSQPAVPTTRAGTPTTVVLGGTGRSTTEPAATRAQAPTSAREILNRLNEVSFNAVLLKELRMMALLRQVAPADDSECARWAAMRLHHIASETVASLGSSSKLNAEWAFLTMLRDEGRRCADTFLHEHGADLGRRPSFDLDRMLDGV